MGKAGGEEQSCLLNSAPTVFGLCAPGAWAQQLPLSLWRLGGALLSPNPDQAGCPVVRSLAVFLFFF